MEDRVTGRWQLNANLLSYRTAGGVDATPSHFACQFQAKFRARPALEYGLQAFGAAPVTVATGARLDATHRLGPAVFGRYRLPNATGIRYNAGLLFGATRGAADRTIRAQIEYEF